MERCICIHGHFYQPPRENPWLESVELQDSAYPYHDWNERVTAECYAPNGAARILDAEGRIARLANNYSRISFNFGPTLLSWLQLKAPDTYRALLDADRDSQTRFSGHGSALAQVYNHIIMPLANRRDKVTQVLWGLDDFRHRFGRNPEGMWLAEAAVDFETLDVLAEQGIRFTVLSPYQAARIRPLGHDAWQDVNGGSIDPTRAYLQRLPSGRSICLFFYDGHISRAVAFERLLLRGEYLVDRLMGAFSGTRTEAQLVHIATDGESYGHHHSHGDMALAAAIQLIEDNPNVRLTNYGEFLDTHLPTHEVEVHQNSSWSCFHGVERWRSNCGCNSGRGDWSQEWRKPLRESLDWLRDALAVPYEKLASRFFREPWAARNDGLSLILDRSPENVSRWLREHAVKQLDDCERVIVLKLLEMQRQALLMYTSCGWFFDEISGIETVQCIQYAARAIQLGEELSGDDFETGFLDILARAPSNFLELGNGKTVYESYVAPSRVGWEQVGAHYAVSSLFENYPQQARFFCYTAERQAFESYAAGRSRLVVGKARLRSDLTHESATLSFGVLHFGDHHVNGGVKRFDDDETFAELALEAADAFERGDFAEVIRILDRYFGESTYSLASLFRDEQRKVIKQLLHPTIVEAETSFRRLYEHHLPTMRYLARVNVPLPRVFQVTADFLLNTDLDWDLKDEEPNLEHVRKLFDEASTLHAHLDTAGLAYRLKKTLARMAERWRNQPADLPLLCSLEDVVQLARTLPFEVELWQPQNVYCELMPSAFPDLLRLSETGDRTADVWLDHFLNLGRRLGVRVTEMQQLVTDARAVPGAAELLRELLAARRVPQATYRLQLRHGFGFPEALAQVDYLADLGVSDCYLSPILQSRPESPHGYDVTDHSRLNPQLGTPEEFDALAEALRKRGMGLFLDIVPNHMGVGRENPWWNDVLENGPSAVHAGAFDISWHPANRNLENKLLLPVLGDQYGTVLEAGQITLAYEEGAFFLNYYAHRLPVAPDTYSLVLQQLLQSLTTVVGEESEQVRELRSILTALSYLPQRTDTAQEKTTERNREKEVIKSRLARLTADNADVLQAVNETVKQFNGVVGTPSSFDLLDQLIEAQTYRPAYWRVATEEINYRRFFDINDLAAIRVEKPEVFEATHRIYLKLLAEGKVTGLRVDHPDGLWDPAHYFRQLQEEYALAWVRRRLLPRPAPESLLEDVRTRLRDAVGNSTSAPLYVTAEKILNPGEVLPGDWSIDGTTGYDFLNLLNGLFVDSAQAEPFEGIHAAFIGHPVFFADMANEAKKMIMLVSLASEINALSQRLDRISERNRLYRDFTLISLTYATREILACLPVYRTYVTAPDTVSERDRAYIEQAVEEAKEMNPRTAESIFDFVGDTLLLRKIQNFREEDRPQLVEWVMRFQQVSGPVMAKGVEDTALYVFNRLTSLNEVGGHPDHFGVSAEEFHEENLERLRSWPHSQLATSTHDTKRSEDVRARLNVLSEIPGEWDEAIGRWRQLNAPLKALIEDEPAPDSNDEYLLYQTLLGIWPFEGLTPEMLPGFRDRIATYMQKATKEAKIHTSWINANEAYDKAVQGFVVGLLPDDCNSAFLLEVQELAKRLAFYGVFNSLSQVLLKAVCPGVPDFYQGCELWDLSLVDPDNRRPVDYARRRELLRGLKEETARCGADLAPLLYALLDHFEDGRVKLYLTWRLLSFRREKARLFLESDYQPLESIGMKKDHVVALRRSLENEAVVAVAPRLVVGLAGTGYWPMGDQVWGDTWLRLPEEDRGKRYRNVLTGEVLPVEDGAGAPGLALARVLAGFPVALLSREG